MLLLICGPCCVCVIIVILLFMATRGADLDSGWWAELGATQNEYTEERGTERITILCVLP